MAQPCPTCSAVERMFPLHPSAPVTDLAWRRRRRWILHLRFCLGPQEQWKALREEALRSAKGTEQ